jgi:hypothetical protein
MGEGESENAGDETEAAAGAKTKKGWFGGLKEVMYDFTFAPYGQTTERGCWLACFKMIYVWGGANGKGVAVDQVESLLTSGAFGGDAAAFTAATQDGLAPSQRAGALTALNMAGLDRATIKGWGMDEILTNLEKYGPMVFTKQVPKKDGSGDFTTHATVVRGASKNPDIPTIYLVDPYDEDALLRRSPPYTARAIEMGFKVFMGSLPPDGSVSAATALAYLK